jgi:hypothetical protein
MERTSSPDILRRFAEVLERDGIEHVPADLLNDLLGAGRAVDASAIAMAVVVDPTEPAVARERAFGLLSVQIIGRADRVLAACHRPRDLSGRSADSNGQTGVATKTGMMRSVFA